MNTVKYIMESTETEAEGLIHRMGKTVRLHGAIYKIRRMSGFAFVLLRMRDAVVQCVYSEEYTSFPLDLLTDLLPLVFA